MDGNMQIHPFYINCIDKESANPAFNIPSIQIYPNPFTDQIYLIGADGFTLTVFSEKGKTIHIQKITKPTEIIRFDQLDTGLYLFNIEKNGIATTVKVLKKNTR